MRPEFGWRIPSNWPQFGKWKRHHNVLTWRHCPIFWLCLVSLVKFSSCSKFHVNIIIGSGVMKIFFYKRFTRNPEVGNTPFWVLPNISRLGWVRDTKFRTNVANEMLLNAANRQGCSFDCFWVIKGKPTEMVKLLPHPD